MALAWTCPRWPSPTGCSDIWSGARRSDGIATPAIVPLGDRALPLAGLEPTCSRQREACHNDTVFFAGTNRLHEFRFVWFALCSKPHIPLSSMRLTNASTGLRRSRLAFRRPKCSAHPRQSLFSNTGIRVIQHPLQRDHRRCIRLHHGRHVQPAHESSVGWSAARSALPRPPHPWRRNNRLLSTASFHS